MAQALTAIAIANLKPKPQRYEVRDPGCSGLRVVVFPSRRKSFIVRYRYRGGLQCKLTLGPCLIERGVAESDTTPELGTPLSVWLRRVNSPPRLCARPRPRRSPTRRRRSSASAGKSGRPRATRCGRSARNTCVAKVPGCGHSTSAVATSNCSAPASWVGCRSPRSSAVSIAACSTTSPITMGRGAAIAVLSALRTLLSWHAGRSDFISPLVRGMRRTSTRERARERILTDDELRAVWGAAEQDKGPFGPFVQFLLLTATRRGEAAGLRRNELSDWRRRHGPFPARDTRPARTP